jgi:protein-S-isoprenylcysteine O-methyltransferase Ste14
VDELALALFTAALAVLFGLRSWSQRRRTGSTGFRGISGRPLSVAWTGGVLFIIALILGVAGPLLAVTGLVPTEAATGWRVAGLLIALVGFCAALVGQIRMGASWRVGVDPSERTDLVTSGLFALVRNPFFSAIIMAQLGVTLMVPTWVSALALLSLVTAVELQVRIVEEPYLKRAHGSEYDSYCNRVGRFLPRITAKSRITDGSV